MKKLIFFCSLFLFNIACDKSNIDESLLPTIGSPAPEITLNDANGNVVKLSDLKGKVVIVQFWASWCPYCRKDNPKVVDLYKKYKDKGLEIYSVSLDTDKAAWEKAIKDDGLVWKSHVTDLKKWKSPVVEGYDVSATPFKFLIDKEGIVRVINFNTTLTTLVEKYL